MTVKRRLWLTAVGVALGLPTLGSAQQVVWRAAGRSTPAPAVAPQPIARLGRPIAAPAAGRAARPPGPRGPVVRAQAADFDPAFVPPPLGAVTPASHTTAGHSPEIAPVGFSGGPPPPPAPPVPEHGVTTPIGGSGLSSINWPTDNLAPPAPPTPPADPPPPTPPPTDPLGMAPPQPAIPPLVPHTASGPPDALPPPPAAPFSPAEVTPGVMTDRPVAPGFWEKCKGWTHLGDSGSASGRHSFQSDHCNQALVSPVTMPFYFEDPRALTEVRPIFMYQSIPSNTPNFGGGSVTFFGSQFRLAFTDRLSVVIHELGGLWLQPNNPVAPVDKGSGFAEVRMGPKYTFLRNANSGTVAAAGLIFELPVGSASVFQNIGTLSLDPYVTIGQTFGQLPNGYGSFNLLATLGYSFSIDNKRSEFLYTNWHVDYNIANTNMFYPFLEVNWMYYTGTGNSTNLGTEGADLINFGSSTRRGNSYFSLAPGFRYRYSEHLQAGFAIEFPVSQEKGLNDYRLTFDVIFRY
ncbi:MAG: hypothetical protein U0736_00840 [Gemmataceae bacterium]